MNHFSIMDAGTLTISTALDLLLGVVPWDLSLVEVEKSIELSCDSDDIVENEELLVSVEVDDNPSSFVGSGIDVEGDAIWASNFEEVCPRLDGVNKLLPPLMWEWVCKVLVCLTLAVEWREDFLVDKLVAELRLVREWEFDLEASFASLALAKFFIMIRLFGSTVFPSTTSMILFLQAPMTCSRYLSNKYFLILIQISLTCLLIKNHSLQFHNPKYLSCFVKGLPLKSSHFNAGICDNISTAPAKSLRLFSAVFKL